MSGEDINMEAKLQKWGNSDGIRIPSHMLKSLNLKTNDKVNIYEENDKIVIYKSKEKHLTIEERIEEFKKLPKEEKGNIESFDWGEDMGVEKWN